MGEQPMAGVAVSEGKRCVVCGSDCTGRPRVKDPRGRYYCRACYDATSAAAANDLAGNAGAANDMAGYGAASDGDEPMIDLAPLPPPMPTTLASYPPPRPARAARRALQGPALGARLLEFVRESPAAAALHTALVLLIAYGVVFVDQFAWQSLMASVVANDRGTETSWSQVMLVSAIASVIPTLILWVLGPLWYRLRVRWSGGAKVEPVLSRAIYFATLVPMLVWGLLMLVIEVSSFDSPTQSFDDPSILTTLLDVGGTSLIWIGGCVVLFLIAWQGLGAGMGRCIFWFLVLPIAWYALIVCAATVAGVMIGAEAARKDAGENARSAPSAAMAPTGGTSDAPAREATAIDAQPAFTDFAKPSVPAPPLTQFRTRDEVPYAFSYPASWTVREQGFPNAPFRMALVGDANAMVGMVLIEHNNMESEDLVEWILRETIEGVRFNGEPRMIDRLAHFTGHGRAQRALVEGKPSEIVLFLRPAGNGRRLVLITMRLEPDKAGSQANIDRVLRSLRVTAK